MYTSKIPHTSRMSNPATAPTFIEASHYETTSNKPITGYINGCDLKTLIYLGEFPVYLRREFYIATKTLTNINLERICH